MEIEPYTIITFCKSLPAVSLYNVEGDAAAYRVSYGTDKECFIVRLLGSPWRRRCCRFLFRHVPPLNMSAMLVP
jgi:hypothetical protein